MNWYYEKNEETLGPISLEELLPHINAETLVWREDSLEDWVEAKEHPDLVVFFKESHKDQINSYGFSLKEEKDTSASNDELAESNVELIKNTEQLTELNKKLEEALKESIDKQKLLEEEKKQLQDNLTSKLQETEAKEKADAIAKTAKEKADAEAMATKDKVDAEVKAKLEADTIAKEAKEKADAEERLEAEKQFISTKNLETEKEQQLSINLSENQKEILITPVKKWHY